MSEDAPNQTKRAGGRKLAEWVTMGLSALLVLGVAAYLAYEAVRVDPPFVPVDARVLIDQAQEKDGRYIVPVELRNHGRQTLKGLTVQVTSRSPDGTPRASDFLIDYLGRGASQKVYLYFDQHPAKVHVQVKPQSYELE